MERKSARINEVEIHVTSESVDYNNQISDHPVEDKANITDHVKPEPVGLSLTGIVVNDPITKQSAALKKQQLKGFMDKAKVVTYQGRNAVYDCIISNFKTDHDAQITNGFRFTMTLRVIQFAKVSTAEVPVYEEDKYETEPIKNVGIITPRSNQYTNKRYYNISAGSQGRITVGEKVYYLKYTYDASHDRKIVELLDSNMESLETTSAELGNVIFAKHLPVPFKVIDPPGDTATLLSGLNMVYLELLE